MDPDGRIELVLGTLSAGQGHETSFAQILAEWLGVDLEQVRLVTGDTDRVAVGGGSSSGRSMRLGAVVMAEASDQIVARGARVAAWLLEAAEADIEFRHRRFGVKGTDRAVGLFEVAAAALRADTPAALRGPLVGVGDETMSVPSFAYGCAVCEVEIDPETGMVEIARYTSVDDVGRAINPLLIHGQTHGGIAQGVGRPCGSAASTSGRPGSSSPRRSWSTRCRARTCCRCSRARSARCRRRPTPSASGVAARGNDPGAGQRGQCRGGRAGRSGRRARRAARDARARVECDSGSTPADVIRSQPESRPHASVIPPPDLPGPQRPASDVIRAGRAANARHPRRPDLPVRTSAGTCIEAGRGGRGHGSSSHVVSRRERRRVHGTRVPTESAARLSVLQTCAIRYRVSIADVTLDGPLARFARRSVQRVSPWPQNERRGEAVLHVREDGRWEVDLRERFGSDEERRPPRSRRILWCFVSRRDPKHPGLRQVLRSSERCFVASHPGSLVARSLSGPRFSWQYPNAASMVSGAL